MDSGYSTDDEEWWHRQLEEERQQARKDVAALSRKMVEGRDRSRIAYLMGLSSTRKLSDKVREGRFSAVELLHLSYLCGYEIKAEDKYQTMLDMTLG